MLIVYPQTGYGNIISPEVTTKKAKTYQVEILIYQIKDHLTTEDFTHPQPAINSDDPQVLLEANNEQKNYMRLPQSMLTLNREENLLSKKDRYTILLHEGWLQQQNNEKTVLLTNEFIEGTIKINRAYYYNTNLHLAMLNTSTPFVIKTKRKLKNNEMHYIDHPKFGVLLKIITL